MESACRALSLGDVLRELDKRHPGVPLLALGQTVFWDEPMKAGVVRALRQIGSSRRFVAGVHDTDYFAKLKRDRAQVGRFRRLPHNDTTTRGLWSAAGEFSSLFGSETVITQDTLRKAGVRLERLEQARPGAIDEATEAWGWRGIASLDDPAPTTLQVKLADVEKELFAAIDWSFKETLNCLADTARQQAEERAAQLRRELAAIAQEMSSESLASYYRRILPLIYNFVSPGLGSIETTQTSDLLRINLRTSTQPRFSLANLFFAQETRAKACQIYDEAIAGSGLYRLAKFGSGAVPFDLLIPGLGRGTVRIGKRGIVIATPKPQFLTLKRPLRSVEEFAELVEAKFGSDCVLFGKAVTLIGMLSAEFSFAFHEGASGYVSRSIFLHKQLRKQLGWEQPLNPILRIQFSPFDHLGATCSWMRLPAPLQRAFGSEELCSPSFAMRWKEVVTEQKEFLAKLPSLKGMHAWMTWLDQSIGGRWATVAREYDEIKGELGALLSQLRELKETKHRLYAELREAKSCRQAAEYEAGAHFRQGELNEQRSRKRAELLAQVDHWATQCRQIRRHLKEIERTRRALVGVPEVRDLRIKQRALELESELMRVKLVRNAVIAGVGLEAANRRPSAWWFPLVSPEGEWFRTTVETSTGWLEELG
jgi:hypothetical protein